MCGMKLASVFVSRSLPDIRFHIEHDFQTAKAFTRNIQARIWVEGDFRRLSYEQLSMGNHVFAVDVGDVNYMQRISDYNITVASASPPCPSWSNAGNKRGLGEENAASMPSLTRFIFLFSPSSF